MGVVLKTYNNVKVLRYGKGNKRILFKLAVPAVENREALQDVDELVYKVVTVTLEQKS